MIARLSHGPWSTIAIGAASAAAAVFTMAIAKVVGPTAALLLVPAVIVGLLLLSHARAAVLLALIGTVVCESDAQWGIGATTRFYERLPASLTLAEVLVLLAAVAVVLDVRRRGEPLRAPRAFGAVLLFAAATILFGLINSHYTGGAAGYSIRSVLHTLAPLFVVPFVIVNVVRTPRDLRAALGVAGGVAIAKAVAGLGVLASGVSQRLSAGGPHMTYYEATSNVLLMTMVFGLAAAPLAGVKLPRWLMWAAPLIFLCLLLSYRRMFWVATVLGLLVVAVVAGGRVGRRLAVPVLVVLAGSVWLVSQSQVLGDLSGPIVQRGATINPSKVTRDTQDRYRIAERHNVVADLKTHPLVGAGIGVGWQATSPMPFEYETGRHYVHLAVLWWWLNMGVLGAITYGWLMLSAVFIGWKVWRRHPDGVVRVAGLAMGMGVLGTSIVELTASFIGPDQRAAILLGVILGLLAVAHAQLPRTAVLGPPIGSIR